MSPQSMWGHIFLSFRSMHGKFMAKHTILTSFNKRGGGKTKKSYYLWKNHFALMHLF